MTTAEETIADLKRLGMLMAALAERLVTDEAALQAAMALRDRMVDMISQMPPAADVEALMEDRVAGGICNFLNGISTDGFARGERVDAHAMFMGQCMALEATMRGFPKEAPRAVTMLQQALLNYMRDYIAWKEKRDGDFHQARTN